MKIVDVCESYSERGGGVRTYVHAKLDAAARLGHEVVVVAPGREHRVVERPGGRIRWIPSTPFPFDPNYGLFLGAHGVHRALEEERPDVVEGSSPWGGGRAVASWRGSAVKTFVFHTDAVAVWPQTFLCPRISFETVDRWFRPFWRSLSRMSDAFDATVVSGAWLADRVRAHGVKRPVVVPFGIDKGRFSPARRDPAVRARLLRACQAPPEAKLLVAASRLDPEKRIGTMLEGFRLAARDRPLALALFGRGSLAGWVRKKAAKIPHVHVGGYLGDRVEMAAALASADAFLHGSAAETYGLVVAEALCSGLPAVVPDRGGAAALAQGPWAETYRAGDPIACARALARLFERDPQAARAACEVAGRAVAPVESHFERLFERYGSLLERSHRRSRADEVVTSP